MRNDKRKVTNQLGGGQDRNEQRFVAIATVGKYEKAQIFRVFQGGIHTALAQYGRELKALNGHVKFLVPSQQIAFNQEEVERSLRRLQSSWLTQLHAQLIGVNLKLGYEDQDDFEMDYSNQRKPVYVPKQINS